MKQIFRGLYVFLIALLSLAFSNMLWSAEVDTVWTTDYNEMIKFQHPVTKNIVIEDLHKLVELDSKNGKFLREFSFQNDWGNNPYISPDGTKLLHTNGDHTYIYAYPSMQLIYQLDSCLYGRIISNDEVIGRNFFNSKLVKYNLKTQEKQEFLQGINIRDLAASPDGRFIAYSTKPLNNNEDWTKLILVDAKTMKQIKQLEEVKNTGHQYERMNFSHDGKYLAYTSQVYNDDFQRNIYSTETFKIVKNYNPLTNDNDLLDILFVSDNLYLLNGYRNKGGKLESQLIDITLDKIIFTVDKGAVGATYNKDLNHLYFREGLDGKNYCLNITNLITGVNPTPINTFVKYQNKQLTINKENVRKIEISDISGRLILNKINDNPFSNNVTLPINLTNGSYLINVTTDKENFTHKLMVME